MKKFFSLFAALLLAGSMMATEELKATLDFTSNTAWNLPVGSGNGATASAAFSDGTYSVTLYATTKYYFNSDGYLMLGKTNSTLTLPAFTWNTTKIVVAGRAGASTGTKQNIYVGDNAVSTETTGCTGTNEYAIAADYQAAGNVYVLKVTSNHNAQITKIEIYGEGEGGGEVTPVTPDPEPVDESIVYKWSTVGTTVLGGNSVEVSTVKIHTNTDAVDAIKFSSSYVYADGKWAAIKPAEGGFLAGDTLKLAACFSNSDDTKYAQVDLRAADGNTRIWLSDSASTINGRTSAADPVVQNYVLEADQDSLFLGRYGNTTMFVTSLEVVRPEAPIEPITCLDIYQMAKNDVVELLNDVVVTYANGKNVWVRDASASMLIYLPANGTYAAGDTLSGVAGTVDIYNGVHEIKPTAAQVTAITAKAGVAPAAIPVENVQASDVNKYIVMQMVEAVGTFAEGTASNITINGVTVRNNFKNGYTFTADKTYNVYGVVTIYQSNPQVYFISAEEVPGMKGTYTVGGEGADFATLSAACDAIRTQGMRGNVDFVVCADIAETANIGITNTTKFTLTIRPNAAVKRTITFGNIADNVGPSGHVMIGYEMTGWACTDTKNVLIDGSFEGEGRYLEFQAGTVGGVIVVFYGHVEDALVKSCRLINARPSGTSYIGHFRSENSTKIAGSDKAPIMCGFHDCYMQVTNVANTQAIYYNGSQSATAAGKPQGCYVTGCEIRSNLRGIFFNGAIGATIADNTFIMESASAGFLAHAIMGNAQKGTIEVFGNRFINLKTNNVSAGDFGLQAITASGGASVWNIYNNYFAGLDALGSVADKAIKLCYIRCGDSCVVRHNSFYMPSLTNKPTTELTSATPIACLYLAGEKKYIVENNLFVSAETTAHNSLIRGALNENVKNNVFFHNGGNAAILAGAEIAADSTAFFALEGTTGSAWAAPVFVDAANGNLDIAVANEALMMPQIGDVLDDINGTARGEQTYAGAFEGPEPGQGTSLHMTDVEGVEKIFRNGQVLIIRNGKTYNMMGQRVR